MSTIRIKPNIRQLLTQLETGDIKEKLIAIKRIGTQYDAKLSQFLEPYIEDPNPKIRESIIYALGALGKKDTIGPKLIAQLKDRNSNVKIAIIRTLGEMKVGYANKKLIQLLQSPQDKIRKETIISLGKIGNLHSLNPIIKSLDDYNENVRLNAILALGNLNDNRAVDAILKKLDDIEPIVQMAILTLSKFADPKIVPPLLNIISQKTKKFSQKTRLFGIHALSGVKDNSIIQPLIELLDDEELPIQRAAADILSKIKNKETVQEFIHKMNDESIEIRETAARALGRLADKDSLHILESGLGDRSPKVREECIKSIMEIQLLSADFSKGLIKKISKLFKDKSAAVRGAAVLAIGNMETTSIIAKSVKKLLQDSDRIVQMRAAEALAKINSNKNLFGQSHHYYHLASELALTWEFNEEFYEAQAIGCAILEIIEKGKFINQNSNFEKIFNFLEGSAKMMGSQTFISQYYWKSIQSWNDVNIRFDQIWADEKLLEILKSISMNLLLIEKNVPEKYRQGISSTQEIFNEKFQAIEEGKILKKELQGFFSDLTKVFLKLAWKIFQIEPLKISASTSEGETIQALDGISKNINISNISLKDAAQELTEDLFDISLNNVLSPQRESASSPFKIRSEVIADESDDGNSIKEMKICLVQMLKGVPRRKITEENRDLYEKMVRRYYDFDKYKQNSIYTLSQPGKEQIEHKIFGFLEDAVAENANLIVFPEISVPPEMLEDLQEFSIKNHVFILVPLTTIKHKGNYNNLVYLISPFSEAIKIPLDSPLYLQKNIPTTFSPSAKNISTWKESIFENKHPNLTLFKTPIGRFIAFHKTDVVHLKDYLKFIRREHKLDFILILDNFPYDKKAIK